MNQLLKKWKLIVSLVFLSGCALVFHSQRVINSYSSEIIHDLQLVPTTSVALVFGAGLKSDGTPTDALRDRVLTGVDLYRAGKVRKLLMTGDNGTNYHDEVTAMKKVAVDEFVPEKDIVLDYAGFRTYDSCYRARDIFSLDEVVAVSQDFHLPRILYICGTMGVKTIAYSADKQVYADRLRSEIREFLAKFKAWYQVEITHPKPKFLGKKENVFAN